MWVCLGAWRGHSASRVMRRVAILALALAATLTLAAGDRPRLPREYDHDDDDDDDDDFHVSPEEPARVEPRRRAPPIPPVRRPSYYAPYLPPETRDALATAAALAQRAARAGEAMNALLSDVGATLADELLWMSDQDAGPFGVVYAPLPDDAANRQPPSPPSPPPPPPPPYDFRARGPHAVSRRAVTFYWPAFLSRRAENPRLPWVSAKLYRPDGATALTSAPFPVIAFGVGWNSWTERYDRTLAHLASHGFVVVAPTAADRRPDPASFGVLADHLRACLDWAARETHRSNSPLRGQIDPSRRGLFGHSSGAGAAARAATDARLAAGPGRDSGAPAALAGMGAFSASAGVDLDALRAIRDVAVFQIAGQRDSHVTPRAVARLADAMPRASPRVVAVVRDGTHCFLDEAESYAYPPSQCDAAREGEGVGGWRLLSPEAQMRVTREYLAAFFAGTLGRDPKVAEEGRRRILGEDEGARVGEDEGARVREDTRLVVEPEEVARGEVARGVTLRSDPRMSRVEISTRGG